MNRSNRRSFLKQVGVGTAVGTAALTSASYSRAVGANDRMTVAVVGPGGMGTNHVRTLMGQADVQISHVCDVDRNRLAAAVRNATRDGREPRGETDLRR